MSCRKRHHFQDKKREIGKKEQKMQFLCLSVDGYQINTHGKVLYWCQLVRCNKIFITVSLCAHSSQYILLFLSRHIAIVDDDFDLFWIATDDAVPTVDLVNLAPWHRTIIPKTISTFTFFWLMETERCWRKWHMCCAHHIDHLEFTSVIIHFFFSFLWKHLGNRTHSLCASWIAIRLLIASD